MKTEQIIKTDGCPLDGRILLWRRESREWAQNFVRCGITGWCLEILFTSVDSIMAGDMRLMGRTSLLMFPIYGMGALLGPINDLADDWLTGLPGFETAGKDRISAAARLVRHGLLGMVLIFTAEYAAGKFLGMFGICPWDYSQWPDQVAGVIRLKFAPLWLGTAILFEVITGRKCGKYCI